MSAIHPLINFLVRKLEKADIAIENGNYTEAFVVLRETVSLLRKKHREASGDLIAKLDEIITTVQLIKGSHYADGIGKKKKRELELFNQQGRELKHSVVDLLWDNNYLVQEGYQMVYPANLPKRA